MCADNTKPRPVVANKCLGEVVRNGCFGATNFGVTNFGVTNFGATNGRGFMLRLPAKLQILIRRGPIPSPGQFVGVAAAELVGVLSSPIGQPRLAGRWRIDVQQIGR